MSDIDTLEGAELDAAVAETVMGWHVGKREGGRGDVWLDERGGWSFESPRTFRPRNDMNNLSSVLCKALADGVTITASRALDRSGIWAEAYLPQDYHRRSGVTAPTLPLALCRALVKAYREASHE